MALEGRSRFKKGGKHQEHTPSPAHFNPTRTQETLHAHHLLHDHGISGFAFMDTRSVI